MVRVRLEGRVALGDDRVGDALDTLASESETSGDHRDAEPAGRGDPHHLPPGLGLSGEHFMSSTTVSKAFPQAEAAGPGSGIYLAFIPWVVFTLVAQHSTLKLAAVGALLAAALIAARSVRAGSAKVLELGAVLAFVAFTVIAYTADPATGAFVDRYARAIAAGLLATIAFGSLLVTPFTEQYARESVPRELWSSPLFKQINRQLTTMWGLVFAAMVPAHVIAGALDTHRANLIFNWAIPIVLVIWAASRTARVSDSAKARPSTDTGAAIAIDRNPTALTTAGSIGHGEIAATLRRSK